MRRKRNIIIFKTKLDRYKTLKYRVKQKAKMIRHK